MKNLLAIMLLLTVSSSVGGVGKQSRSGQSPNRGQFEGVVVEHWDGNKSDGNIVESNGKRYEFCLACPGSVNDSPKIVGGDDIREGTRVRVTYANLTRSRDGRVYYVKALTVVNLSKQPGTPKASDNTSASPLVIGDLKNSDVVMGCSCSLSTRRRSNGKYVLLSDYEKKNAWINIDGLDVKLTFVGSTQIRRSNRPERRGDRHTDKWAARGIEVQVDYLVAAPATERKEYTDYETTMTVTKGARSQTIKAFGACGC